MTQAKTNSDTDTGVLIVALSDSKKSLKPKLSHSHMAHTRVSHMAHASL